MIPALTEDGVLPPGIYVASLDEIMQTFGGRTAQRANVTRRLAGIVALARCTQKLRRLFVWGSYISDKAEPGDVDIFLVMAADFLVETCEADVQAAFDGERAEKELGATILWTREDVPAELLEMFLDQWQIGRGGVRRGIVEVE